MNNDINLEASVNTMTEEERKEEELRTTIKMEPILVTTELKEDEVVTKQKKKIKIKDIILIIVIAILLGVLLYIIKNLL
jgi:uncharacterized membrane protein